jgi:hypothetical protein
MPEAIKFRPENTLPQDFMRPPTEPLRLPVAVHALLQEEAINQEAEALTGLIVPGERPRSILRIGSELEFLLFSDESVPHEDVEKDDDVNPNYSLKHMLNVRRLALRMRKSAEEGGLKDVLHDDGDVDRIFMEIRTSPSDASGYMQSMDRITQWFQENASGFHIRPVVWSQHLHLSLHDEITDRNLFSSLKLTNIVKKGIVDIYHRALPMLRLPENVEDEVVSEIGGPTGVLEKGDGWESGPIRLEGRMTNSDYAADPYVNLLFHLIGFKRGLQNRHDHQAIDRDYPLDATESLDDAYFTIGEGHTTFQEALKHMQDDPVLRDELPEELLMGLHDTAQTYWDVSSGQLSASEAREMAYDRDIEWNLNITEQELASSDVVLLSGQEVSHEQDGGAFTLEETGDITEATEYVYPSEVTFVGSNSEQHNLFAYTETRVDREHDSDDRDDRE